MRIYLDVSCLNRPFDDQTQARIHLESVATLTILSRIDQGIWESVSSQMAEIEASAISDMVRRKRVLLLLPESRMNLNPSIFQRARKLGEFGLHAADAVHVAAAECLIADVLLTCDDQLLKRCRQIAEELKVEVANPLCWLQEQNNAENIK